MHTVPEGKRPERGNEETPAWELRPAVREDIPAVSGLFLEMLRTIFRRNDVEGYEEGYLDRYFADGEDRLVVAEAEGKVVGYLAAEVHREEIDYLYFDDLSVSGPYRGRGIGTALIRDAEAYGRKRGIGAFVLHAEKTNDGARRLYERLGYRILAENGTRLRMVKEL